MPDDIHPDGLPVPRRHYAMLAIAIGIAMAVLDGTVANVALPSIARELGASPSAAIWVINAYQLVIVALLLPLASLGERIGYRRVYQVGRGGLHARLARLRAVAQPAAADRRARAAGARRRRDHEHERRAGPPHLSRRAPRPRHRPERPGRRDRRGRGAVRSPPRSSRVGPWPWLFAVNVPFGLVNLWFARQLPRSETVHDRPFDWTSALLSAAMFGLFFVGADALTRGGAGVPAAAGLVAVGGGRASSWCAASAARASAADPVDLFRIPIFALSVIASICAFAAFAIAFVALPFYFQSVLGRDQVATGLLMTPWPVALGLAAPLAGRLSDRLAAGALGGRRHGGGGARASRSSAGSRPSRPRSASRR